MTTVFFACQRLPSLSLQAFMDVSLTQMITFIEDRYPSLVRLISNMIDKQELSPNYMGSNFKKSPYDLLIKLEFSVNDPFRWDEELQRHFSTFAAVTDSYLAEEVIHWDEIPSRRPNARSPGFKIIPFSCRRPGLSQAEFNDHYRTNHSALAREHHPGIGRYVQNFITEKLNPEAPDLDAIAELHFATHEKYRDGFYAHDESPKIIGRDVVSHGDLSRMYYFKAIERIHI